MKANLTDPRFLDNPKALARIVEGMVHNVTHRKRAKTLVPKAHVMVVEMYLKLEENDAVPPGTAIAYARASGIITEPN